MGRMPDDHTPSLDDGIPYWPTISSVAESPLARGLLYAGTDDGALPRVPGRRRDVDGRGGARRDGLGRGGGGEGRRPAASPAFRPARGSAGSSLRATPRPGSTPSGTTTATTTTPTTCTDRTTTGPPGTSIAGDLPAERVLRTVREDLRNESVLFLGAEIGLFHTMDGGEHWTELRGGMPTAAFNDLVIHPRENDLVLGTHGRGVWILDQINALQELTAEVTASDAHLFTVRARDPDPARGAAGAHGRRLLPRREPAERRDHRLLAGRRRGAGRGGGRDRGRAGRAGCIGGGHGAGGDEPRRVGSSPPARRRGRTGGWRRRPRRRRGAGAAGRARGLHGALAGRRRRCDRGRPAGSGVRGPRGPAAERDPPPPARPGRRPCCSWATWGRGRDGSWPARKRRLRTWRRTTPAPGPPSLRDLAREFRELVTRIGRLSGDIEGVVAPLTQDQRSRRVFYTEMLEVLVRELEEGL